MKTYELFLIDKNGNTYGYYRGLTGLGWESDAPTLEGVIAEMRRNDPEIWNSLLSGDCQDNISGYSIAEINPKTGKRLSDEIRNYFDCFTFHGKRTDFWRIVNGHRELAERWYMYDLRD